MIFPDEKLLMTSMVDLSLYSIPCYKNYDKNVTIFLEKYRIISKLFSRDVTHDIMKHLDPRESPVHQFHNMIGCMATSHQTTFYKICSVCGLKVCV